jgi:hypothetical protein
MEYRVIKMFIDLKDNNRQYNVGDSFPRVGLNVSEKRLEELTTSNNRRGEALIEAVEDAEEADAAKEVMEEPTIAPNAEKAEKESEENADNSVAEKGEELKPTKKGRKK